MPAVVIYTGADGYGISGSISIEKRGYINYLDITSYGELRGIKDDGSTMTSDVTLKIHEVS